MKGYENDEAVRRVEAASRSKYCMKTKRTIGIALVMTVVASVSYWMGYESGSGSAGRRLNQVSTVKKIGLGVRVYHNDVGRFTATGGAANPNAPAPE